jgi:protein-disulfide isomerase
MQRDIDDARSLKVTATPEYFVNGRSLPSFGLQQLQDLVNEALRSSAGPAN